MPKTILLALNVALLSALLLAQSGCLLVAAAAGTGAGVAYYKGEVETSMDATPERIADAAKSALEAMDVKVLGSSASALDAEVVARTAGDDRVKISIKSQSATTSKVGVRIGTFGDSSMSHRILEKIREKLGLPTAAPTTLPATQPATRAS